MGADILVFIVIICFILFLTVISNILVLVVMLKVPKILNPTNVLICNLTVSDIILSGVVIPQNIHDIWHATVDYFEGDFSCRLVNFSPLLCVMASIYSMVALSFERKRAIVVTHQKKPTLSQAVRAIPIIWCMSLAFCVPTIYEYSEYKEDLGNGSFITRCGTAGVSTTYSIVNGVVILLLAYVLPLVTLLANYGSILMFFRSRGVFDRSSGNKPVTSRALFKGRMNVVKMLILVAVLFAISWLPYFILLILEKSTGTSDIVDSNGPINMLRIALSVFGTAYNFLLNIVYNNNFRAGFKATFTCQKVIIKNNTVLPVDDVNSELQLPDRDQPARASLFTLTLAARSFTST